MGLIPDESYKFRVPPNGFRISGLANPICRFQTDSHKFLPNLLTHRARKARPAAHVIILVLRAYVDVFWGFIHIQPKQHLISMLAQFFVLLWQAGMMPLVPFIAIQPVNLPETNSSYRGTSLETGRFLMRDLVPVAGSKAGCSDFPARSLLVASAEL